MSIFDKIASNEESKFALEAQHEFKAEARRNKYLAKWAADLFGYDEDKTSKYILEVIASDMEEAGDDDVFRKLRADFDKEGYEMTDSALRAKMTECLYQARNEVHDELYGE